MSEACQLLHNLASQLLKQPARFDEATLPAGGVYLIFEHGENAHGTSRIVRAGTHGSRPILKRIHNHFTGEDRHQSVFRRHIGTRIFKKRRDPLFKVWDLKRSALSNAQLTDVRLERIEKTVTEYVRRRLSFAVIPVPKSRRGEVERGLIGTISACRECAASAAWLGRFHYKSKISEGKLWNIHYLSRPALDLDALRNLFGQRALPTTRRNIAAPSTVL